MLKKLFVIFKVGVILNLLICLINMEWTSTFICLCNFILFFLADYIQNKFKYGDFFRFFIYLFLLGSLVGGEVYYLYVRIEYYDVIMHGLSSFIASGLFVYIFRRYGVNINRILFVISIFSFAMMVAGLWEIFEFSVDRILDRDMQKDTVIAEINSVLLSEDGKTIVNKKINSMVIGDYTINGYLDIGLYDTIGDMICAVFGSILYIIIDRIKEAF